MSPGAALRGLCAAALAACALAVFVARCEPRGAEFRSRSDPHLAAFHSIFLDGRTDVTWVLDTTSGALSKLPTPDREVMRWPGFSPWTGPGGERQVVGLWVEYHANRGGDVLSGTGLARFSYPSGRVVDRVRDCPAPARTPCWFPGPQPRVLYAAADGRLYQCAFDPDRGPEVKPVDWPVPAGRRAPRVESLAWPDVPVLRGRVLAAVDWSISLGDRTPYRLWWLTLSPDGTRVDASGPVALDGPEVDPSLDWREPVVSPVAEGGYQLAWLLHRDRHAEGDLYVAPFRAGGRRAEPTVDMAQARKIAGNVHVARPAFSPDGESVYAVQRQAGKLPAVRKFSVHGEWISRRPGDDGRQWSDASPSRLTTSGRFDDGPPTR